MKSSTKILTSMAILASVASSSSALAMSPDGENGRFGHEGPNNEQRAEFHQAIENHDYNAFRNLLAQQDDKGKKLENINEGNFETFVEFHLAMKEHDRERAKELAGELGIEVHKRGGRRGHNGRMGPKLDEGVREELKAAVDSGDYDAFKTILSENGEGEKVLEKITPENFGKLKEMHEAMQSGDKETAKNIADELGVKRGKGGRFGQAGARGGKFGGQRGGPEKVQGEQQNQQ